MAKATANAPNRNHRTIAGSHLAHDHPCLTQLGSEGKYLRAGMGVFSNSGAGSSTGKIVGYVRVGGTMRGGWTTITGAGAQVQSGRGGGAGHEKREASQRKPAAHDTILDA